MTTPENDTDLPEGELQTAPEDENPLELTGEPADAPTELGKAPEDDDEDEDA